MIRISIRVAIASALSLAGIWLLLGRPAAEKIATSLVMPTGLVWLALFSLVAWCMSRKQRAAAGWALTCWALYSLAGSGHLSTWLAESLERPFVQISPLEQPPMDTVVVLGGGGSFPASRRAQGNGSGDRLILAAQLYHQGLAAHLICTGRRIDSMDSTGVDPADISAEVLLKLGVPAAAIEKVGGRTTSEEMATLAARFSDPSRPVGLVTSAWHLRRAIQLAEKNGLHVVPLPADVRSPLRDQSPTVGQIVDSFIPKGDAFQSNAAFLKEYLGALVGR